MDIIIIVAILVGLLLIWGVINAIILKDKDTLSDDTEHALKLEQIAKEAKSKGDIEKYIEYNKKAEELLLKHLK